MWGMRAIHLGLCTARRRRCVHCAWLIPLLLVFSANANRGNAQDWKSGQDSPVHDSDRLYPLGPASIVLENGQVSLTFDQRTGALLQFTNKATGWRWQTQAKLGESFNLFVPTADRSYNPVLGARNTLASFQKSADGQTLQLVWSQFAERVPGPARHYAARDRAFGRRYCSIRYDGRESFAAHDRKFELADHRIDCGAGSGDCMFLLGTMATWPFFRSGIPLRSPWGITGRTIRRRILDGRFILVSTPDQGLYVGAHNPDAEENVKYMFEVKPGFLDSYDSVNPKTASISGHPVRLSLQVVHYPFLNPGESGALAPIVLGPYRGDWHAGGDIYKQWLTTWFHPLPMPAWAEDIHAWQQLQINSSEDDLRTRYVDLPKRVADDAKHGVTALQLVGWNHGRPGPRQSHGCDTDPRLGTTAELRDAIAQIENAGVHVVLFAKYAWADTSTDWYKQELYKHMATDPYGDIYTWAGYRYQTPEQLAGINPRNLATACPNDAAWRKILAQEFQKVIDLGANGVLFDEAQHRHSSDYNLCFNPNHGHHVPATIWSGDIALANMYREMIRDSVGEKHFLFSGEEPEDVLEEAYSLSYLRINRGHTPEERYVFPFRPMMIAVTGFDDREMINRALMDRYILSYEPFNFKGNLSDFPLTVAYGEKVDALRRRYRDYLWDAEFRDTLGARVEVAGAPYKDYSVFVRKNGRRAVVVVNDGSSESIDAIVSLDKPAGNVFRCATPESPDAAECQARLSVPPRSAVVLMEP